MTNPCVHTIILLMIYFNFEILASADPANIAGNNTHSIPRYHNPARGTFPLFMHTNYSESYKQICQKNWENAMTIRGGRSSHIKQWGYGILPQTSTPPHILNIRVGKTCGSLIESILMRRKIDHAIVHTHPADQMHIEDYKYIFISIRDPISRMVSVFNYHHPLTNISSGRLLHSGSQKFYNCFHTVEEYAQNLTSDTHCGDLARRGIGHGPFGYCFYVGGIRKLLKARKEHVYVIEQEYCVPQLTEALRMVGRPVNVGFDEKSRNVNHVQDILPTTLSTSAGDKLRKFLESNGEYDLYYELKEMSVSMH